MIQQVNLYLPEFRKEKDWLVVDNMLRFCVVLVVVLIGISGLEYWGSNSLESELEAKRLEREEAISRTNALIDNFGEQSADQNLAETVRQLEVDLSGKQDLLEFLEGRNLGNTDGFSEYLADLSRYQVPGLRLTAVNLQNGGDAVLLSGEVFRAEYVPLFLQSLSRGQSFLGKSFETLRIEESDGDTEILVFDVATTAGGQ